MKILFSDPQKTKQKMRKRQLRRSVTISRAFARKGKLKIFFRAQKMISRAMREKLYFKRFLGFLDCYVVKNDNIFKKYLIFKISKFKPTLKRKKMQ